MTSYLVESYLADSPAAAEEARERARSLTDGDTGVRYMRTTFVPGDETVIYGIERLNRVACNSPGNPGTRAESTRNRHISIWRK